MTDFLSILNSGPGPNPTYLDSAIGPSYFTPEQWAFRERANRRKYGEGDPDAGGYQMSRIHWNKENGTLSYMTCDAGPAAWYGESTDAACGGGGGCAGCS